MKLSVVLSFYRSIPMLIRELCKKNSVAHRFHRFQITLLLSLVNVRNGSRRGSNHCLLRRSSQPGSCRSKESHDHRDHTSLPSCKPHTPMDFLPLRLLLPDFLVV